MKIAMIGQKGIPAKSGGVEKHVEQIASKLVEKGYDVTVYCRNTYSKENRNEYKGVKLKIIKTIDNKNLDAIVYTFRATIDAIKNKFDIYHYHAIGPASLSFIPSILGKKVIVTVHGLDWQRGKWGKFAKLYLKFGEFITGKYATKIITVSDNLREYFIKKYNRKAEDVIFIANGVEINKPQSADLIKKYGLDKDDYLLFLARLVPEKGAHYLVQAYDRLNTDKKLVIAGGSSFSDDYIKELKKYAGSNPKIIFTGDVQGKLKAELYSNCYLYILPSDIEGMPLTLLEAMSYSKCCLVSNIPENIYLIKDKINGYQFLKSDINDLYHKMETLINQESIRNGKGEEAKREIQENYNWEKICNEVAVIYNLCDEKIH